MNCKHARIQLYALSTIRNRETSESNHLPIKDSALAFKDGVLLLLKLLCHSGHFRGTVLFICLFIGGFDWTVWTLSSSGWPRRTAAKCFMLSPWSSIDPDSKKLSKRIRRSSEYWCSPSSLHRKQWWRLSKSSPLHLCAALLSLLLGPTLARKSSPTCHTSVKNAAITAQLFVWRTQTGRT